jgi:phosphohistidine phosphatase
MNLLLMRHGKSSWSDDGVTDHERPLSARGREDATSMATVLIENNIVPKMILVSSSRRTMETVERMMVELPSVTVKVIPELYHASPMALLEIIHNHGANVDPLMVVGHNPGMETTVSNIAGHLVPFPSAALAHAVIRPGESSEMRSVWRPNETFPR